MRLPRKLDGDLPPDDPFHSDLEDVRTDEFATLPGTFVDVETAVAGPDYSVGRLASGSYEARIADHAQGLGLWSNAAPFAVI